MSHIEKLLIPLIDDTITYDNISDKDFIGIFTEDINSPGLDYVYLVYNYDMQNLKMNLSINGSDLVRRINGKLYHLIKFPRSSLDLKNILCGNYSLISNKGINKIYNFWNGKDDYTANYPLSRVISAEKYYRAIPEEEYVPFCERKGKPRGFTVQKQ